MADMIGMHDTTRGVLRFSGSDARDVLQGVVTNDVNRVIPGQAVYSALLTPQGKYLSDFFMLDGGEGAVLIDVAVAQAQALAQKLQMYALRRDAVLSVEQGCELALLWSRAGEEAVQPDEGDGFVVRDPRDPDLGWRRYGTGADDWLNVEGIEIADISERDALRVALVVPETGVELISDETYILEAGFERLSGVDFSKGCYVGQEVTARMKHKTSLRKGLVQVSMKGDAATGTPVTSAGKPAGTLFTHVKGQGLAHLRLDRAGPDMQAGPASVAYDQTAGEEAS